MKITPLEIEKMEFKSAMLGFDKKQVKNFLNEIANDLTSLVKENRGLKDKVDELQKVQDDYKSMEKKLQSTLMVIQDLKNSIKENAEKQADHLLAETKLQCNVMVNEAEKNVEKIKTEFETISIEKTKLVNKLKMMLQEEFAILTNFENEDKSFTTQKTDSEKKE